MTNMSPSYSVRQTPEAVARDLASTIRALDVYANTGKLYQALAICNLSHRAFYRCLKLNDDLNILYRDLQTNLADMLVNQAADLSNDRTQDAKEIRARADIKLRIAAMYDRKRFGQTVQHELDAGPNLLKAMEEARARAGLPQQPLRHDLEARNIQVIDLTAQLIDIATEPTSVALDPFAD